MTKKVITSVLVVIILLGAILRFYNLGSVALGFFRDEAALGFNTWSILKTGADEYGQRLPIIFRSFEVFFMPAYVYFSLPFFFVLGQTVFATRALAATSGVLLILFTYLIAKEFFKKEKLALVAAFLVSISPWAIFYSRGAFEGNLALLFFSIGVYFWLKFMGANKSNPLRGKKFFFVSILGFIASMYSYQAPRFVAPLFIGFSILSQKGWWKNWRLWLAGAIFALALYLPILTITSSPAGYHRAIGVSVFSGSGAATTPKELLSLYFQYFSPANLFSQNDYDPQRRVEGYSVFYLWMLPFFLVGIWKFVKEKFKGSKYFLIWLFLAPIPASLTRDPFHTYRSLLVFLPLTLVIALGLDHVLENWKKAKKILVLGFCILIFYSVSAYFFALFKIAPVVNGQDWDYGYNQVTEFIKSQPQDLRVVIDDPNTDSYIHILFNGGLPIREYQKVASEKLGDRYYTTPDRLRPEKVGRFEFRKVNWPSERGEVNTLFIFPSNRLPPSEFATDPKLRLEKTIYLPSGEPAFYIIRRTEL